MNEEYLSNLDHLNPFTKWLVKFCFSFFSDPLYSEVIGDNNYAEATIVEQHVAIHSQRSTTSSILKKVSAIRNIEIPLKTIYYNCTAISKNTYRLFQKYPKYLKFDQWIILPDVVSIIYTLLFNRSPINTTNMI